MIIQFVFSLLVSLLCTIFCCIVSGGGFGGILVQWVLILGFLSILVLYSILSGNGRNLVNIFLTKQKRGTAPVSDHSDKPVRFLFDRK